MVKENVWSKQFLFPEKIIDGKILGPTRVLGSKNKDNFSLDEQLYLFKKKKQYFGQIWSVISIEVGWMSAGQMMPGHICNMDKCHCYSCHLLNKVQETHLWILVKVGPVITKIKTTWTNVARTHVADINVTMTFVKSVFSSGPTPLVKWSWPDFFFLWL